MTVSGNLLLCDLKRVLSFTKGTQNVLRPFVRKNLRAYTIL